MSKKFVRCLIIVSLLVGVVGISIGFAAYSDVLQIKPSLTVTPDSKYFKVNFSSSSLELETNPIEPTKSDASIVASSAVIDNLNSPTIKNLSAVFTEPGQYVVYSFYAYNTGRYNAYLNDVTFKNIDGKNVNKECIALPGTSEDLVNQVCGDIQITVQVGSTICKETTNNIQDHVINRNAAEAVTIKFTYVNNDHYADGDFEIDFGDITLSYASVD